MITNAPIIGHPLVGGGGGTLGKEVEFAKGLAKVFNFPPIDGATKQAKFAPPRGG